MKKKTLCQHIDALAKKDKHVAAGLELVGYPEPRVRPQGIETFLSIVVGQQISTEAAAAIMRRVRKLLPEMHEEAVLDLPDGALREAGLSNRKVEYVQGIATAIKQGDLQIDEFPSLDDDEVIRQITALRGFGRWSAEIYLMFSLQRQDVFAADDLALLIALQKLKRMRARPTPKKAREKIKHWAPYRTAGSVFLWHYYRGAPT
ncbi:MAG: DNA-3-methyladenine glycosylase 2 family protein [Pseudomonadota bacterium]